MRELVLDLHRDLGVTTLFVTHDQEEAVVLADRIALVLDGRLQQYAEPQQFYAAPASLAVARFFGTANLSPGIVAGGRHISRLGDVAVPAATPDGPGVLVVRQEAVALTSPTEPGTLAGQVRTAVFLGTAVRVEVVLASGAVVTAVVYPSDRVAAGDLVGVRLPASACTVMQED